MLPMRLFLTNKLALSNHENINQSDIVQYRIL